MERSLIVIKPDGMHRGLVGEIISRFERAGLKIIGIKMVAPDEKHFHEHYEGISKLISRWGKDVYKIMLEHMSESPVVAFVVEGVDAVEHVRKMVGATDPKDSPAGTIRGDYTHITRGYTNLQGGTLPNIVHASGNKTEAAKEIALWFNKGELYDYKLPHEQTIRGRSVLNRPAKVKKPK